MLKWPFRTKDKKPLLLSFVLQRDSGSRLLGDYYEKYLDKYPQFLIVAKNGGNGVEVFAVNGITIDEASIMCAKGALRIQVQNG